MDFLTESLQHALRMILSGDGEILVTVWTSLYTSAAAILLAAAVGVPAGTALGLGRFAGRRTVLTLLTTLMALPTVVVPQIITVQGELVSTWQDARLYAAMVGVAAYFWRRDVLITILAGMAVYLPLRLGLGW